MMGRRPLLWEDLVTDESGGLWERVEILDMGIDETTRKASWLRDQTHSEHVGQQLTTAGVDQECRLQFDQLARPIAAQTHSRASLRLDIYRCVSDLAPLEDSHSTGLGPGRKVGVDVRAEPLRIRQIVTG